MEANEPKTQNPPESEDERADVLAGTIYNWAKQSVIIYEVIRSLSLKPLDAINVCYIILESTLKHHPDLKAHHETLKKVINPAIEEGFLDVVGRPPLFIGGKVEKILIEYPQILRCKFTAGELDLSPGVKARQIPPERMAKIAEMHLNGDWGPFLSDEERHINDENMKKPQGKIYSIHRIDPANESNMEGDPDNLIYVITVEDRSKTSWLLAREY